MQAWQTPTRPLQDARSTISAIGAPGDCQKSRRPRMQREEQQRTAREVGKSFRNGPHCAVTPFLDRNKSGVMRDVIRRWIIRVVFVERHEHAIVFFEYVVELPQLSCVERLR